MDDPNQENIESNWVMINSIDIAEEATTLNSTGNLEEDNKIDKNHDGIESDIESDGISIISESSHLHDSTNEEENNTYENSDGDDAVQTENINDHASAEVASDQKANWTFVDSEARSPEMDSSNRFYLNCLQEPVQELSEHELGSVQSDSDGVSIISDCESFNDLTDDEKKLSPENLAHETFDNEKLELTSRLPPGIKKYCNGVLIGTILLATSSIFLGHYFNSVEQMEEELPIYKEEYKNELNENVAEKINKKYEVPTALAYCQEHHKSDGIFMEHNVNKCLKQISNRMKRKKEIKTKNDEINKREKCLKIKEQYLEEKEQFLIKRESELLKAELKLKQDNLKKNKEGIEEHKLNKADEQLNEFHKAEAEKDLISEKHKKRKEKRHTDFKDKIRYEYIRNYSLKHMHKSKTHNAVKSHNANIVYTWRHKKEKSTTHNVRKNEKPEKNKRKKEKLSKHMHNLFTENIKNNKKNHIHVSSAEDHRSKKYKESKIRGSSNYIILDNKDNETISGYWVGRLYKGRNDMRNKKHGGDWYFDRASYRKTKRDKAKWYFDWMMDREILRYKRSLYI